MKGRSGAAQWACLLALSLVFVALAESLRLPAALLIGPMLAAVMIGAWEGTIRVPPPPIVAAQGVIGCMIGRSVPLSIAADIAHDWPLYLFGIVSVLATASALGVVLARTGLLPGSTAIWGTSPGAAAPMILMSEAYGADMRLVAVMQYLRIVCVAILATVVAKIWVVTSAAPPPQPAWLAPVAVLPLAATLVIAFGGATLATVLRLPAGQVLLPLAATMAASSTGHFEPVLPPWLLAACFALIGWSIGLRFNRPILLHAARALPAILTSVVALISVCGLIAVVLAKAGGIDPLTAFLATCPGGVDSIAIITAASPVDVHFVMAMQISRLLAVLYLSPVIARRLAGWHSRRQDS